MAKLSVPPNIIGSSKSDKIRATTTAFNDIGIQVDINGLIDTLGGNDIILGAATGDSGYGINDEGSIFLGSGNDSIKGIGSFTGIQVSQTGILNGGSGNDLIFGTANSRGFDHNANGMEIYGYLTGGSGDDIIKGEAYGIVARNFYTGLICVGSLFNSALGVIDGGNGNDVITGIGINENGFGFGFGIITYDGGAVRGGSGNDTITGYGTTAGYGSEFLGLTILEGGSGDDYFKARLIDSQSKELANQGGAIINTLVLGGNGRDTFDVGYGNGTLNGGQGFDAVILHGCADNYSIQGGNGDFSILKDGYTLNALSIESIVFVTNSFET